MRIGYIGHFGLWHTELGIADALEKKATVDRYHYEGMDLDRFTEREYDIVLTSLPHMLPPKFWKRQKGIKVAHYFDLIVNFQNREKAYFPALKEFDLVLSPDGFDSTPYTRAGINRRYFTQGIDPTEHYRVKGKQSGEVGFLGHGYGNRTKLFRELGKRFDFEVAGEKDEMRGDKHPRWCASKKILIATNATNDIPGYWSIRVYQYLAAGGFCLHSYVEGLDRYFTDGKHLVVWRDKNDLFEKIEHYLKNPNARRKIANAGYSLVMERDTWDARMEEFWSLVSDSSVIRTKPRVLAASSGSYGRTSETRYSPSRTTIKGKRSGPTAS